MVTEKGQTKDNEILRREAIDAEIKAILKRYKFIGETDKETITGVFERFTGETVPDEEDEGGDERRENVKYDIEDIQNYLEITNPIENAVWDLLNVAAGVLKLTDREVTD